MPIIDTILFLLIVVFGSTAITYFMIRFARSNNILSVPNSRSFHNNPTPIGGGIFLPFSLIACVCFLYMKLHSLPVYFLFLCFFAIVIFVTGLIDDFIGSSIGFRATIYFSAAILYVLILADTSGNDMLSELHWLRLATVMIAILTVAWLTNLYNFMDGADAFVGVQTLLTGLPAGILLYLSDDLMPSLLCFTLVASTIGFLIWNWPPAKIFIGDSGSCTLGFIFGSLMVTCFVQQTLSIYIWLILLSYFIVDSTLTLIMRFLKGEKWYHPHRSHAFHLCIIMGMSHLRCSLTLLFFGIFILWPIVILVYHFPEWQIPLTLCVYLFLFLIWIMVQYRYRELER